ncbi:repressor LexA, partial [Kitasatospora sp. NPDC004799]
MTRRTDSPASARLSTACGRPSAKVTERQRRVIEVIRDSVQRRGYPPSMREIGQAV